MNPPTYTRTRTRTRTCTRTRTRTRMHKHARARELTHARTHAHARARTQRSQRIPSVVHQVHVHSVFTLCSRCVHASFMFHSVFTPCAGCVHATFMFTACSQRLYCSRSWPHQVWRSADGRSGPITSVNVAEMHAHKAASVY